MVNHIYKLFLFFTVIVVSACTHMQAPTTQSVSLRNDPGIITPLPPGQRSAAPLTAPNDALTGYNNPMPSNNTMMYGQAPMQNQDMGFVMPNDTSVTIFPVDGTMAPGVSQYGVSQAMPNNYGGQMVATDNRIFFKDGSSRLGSIDQQRIQNAAQQAQYAPMVSVEGYASRPTQAGSNTVESHILNLKQSMNRSYAVARELMRDGVPGEKVKAVSWGSARATGNDNFDRRVDINYGAAY